MTRINTTSPRILLVAMLFALSSATFAKAADIGPETIMLEQIGAVRMVPPQVEGRQHTSNASSDQSQPRAAH